MTDSRLTKTELSHSAAVRALLALWNTRRGEASLSNDGDGESSTGSADSSLPEGEDGMHLRELRLRQNARTGARDLGNNNSKKGATTTLWFV